MSFQSLAVVFVALSALSSAVHAKVTRTVEKAFTVQPAGQVRAETQGGNITVKTDDGNTVRIVATQVIDANSDAEADRVLEKLSLTFDQSGNQVTVRATYEKRGLTSSWGNWPPVQVSYAITLPRKFNADLNTSGGDITVASLQGNVNARTSGGNLVFERIEGDLDGKTSGGNVTLLEGTAKARLSTSGGSVHIDRAAGPTSVSTSGGNITVNSATQMTRATTSGGDIRIKLSQAPQQPSTYNTSGGDITVQLPVAAAWTLDAETSGGEVRVSGVPMNVTKSNSSKSRLAGTVNGGGPTLSLHTSGGDIKVRAE